MPAYMIYFDNHSTTRVDPRVVEAMLPYFAETYGNAGSSTHAFGHAAKRAVEESRERIAASIHATAREIVFTSGATESNNLAIRGVAEAWSSKGRHLVSAATEHPSVLEPLEKLRRRGFEITLLPVIPASSDRAGCIDPDRIAEAIRPDTILVSIMLANNEIGAIHPLAEIGRICKQRGVLLHSDATQAVGKIAVDVEQLQVDLMSFSAHKIYGPKGVGSLYVRKSGPRVKLESQIEGGGQESRLRSGTLNVPGLVGFAKALELCLLDLPGEQARLRTLRDRLHVGIAAELSGVVLNGPAPGIARLPGNLNLSFHRVDGETLLIKMPDIALSSGSACSSATPEPSHVLRALGVSNETARGSVRFGLGRFNTPEEVEHVIRRVVETVTSLRKMIEM
jgi:cysteine desulfurase